jgi:methylated-DNA-protein-cysteine methyltransferase-like protein
VAKSDFSRRALEVIRAVPRGRVATYGQIADLAGNPRAARQVVRLLHSSSERERLPWHRVVNARGEVSLPAGRGREEQRALLEAEGVVFDDRGRIDLKRFRWNPT